MALTRVYGRVVYPHGSDTPTPVTGDGVIEYVHATPGIIDGAVHGPDRHRIEYTDGVAGEAWLKAGMWRAYVYPSEGRSYTLHLGVPEGGETAIADAVGEVVPEGIVTKGDPGEPGEPGRDGQDGQDGHTPEITFDGTTIVVDGVPGPDLKGEPGEGGGGIAGMVPIFPTLAEAQAWEAANPGKTAYTIESADRDTEPPYWPQGVAVTATPGYDSVRFTLSAMAQDDQGVTGYDVSLDSGATWVEATREAMDLIVPASPATTYPAVQIRARDGAGNVSSPLTGSGGFTTLSAPPITYREAVLADEPVYYLPLDDAVGSTTVANLGTAGGTLTPTAFTFGGAGIGDGSSAAVLTTDSKIKVPGAADKSTGFTVEGIVQLDQVPTAVSRFLQYTTGSLLQISTSPDIAAFFGAYMAGKPLSVGKSAHFAFVYEPSGQQKLYVNGARSTPVTQSNWSSQQFFEFGLFAGRAAGLAYFNKPLPDARVQAHAASSGAVA